MKKMIFTLAITTFIASTVLVGCQGSTKKEEAAKDKIEEANKKSGEGQDGGDGQGGIGIAAIGHQRKFSARDQCLPQRL